MRARRSTVVLAVGWLATFVVYVFVRPDDIVEHAPAPPVAHHGPGKGVPADQG